MAWEVTWRQAPFNSSQKLVRFINGSRIFIVTVTLMAGIFSDPIYLILTVFSYIGQFLLSTISIITSVFIYFDLNEQKNLTGITERIDSLGKI